MLGLGSSSQSNDRQDQVLCLSQNGKPQCAWCNEEQGITQGNGSHGICENHAEEQYEQYKASRIVVSKEGLSKC